MSSTHEDGKPALKMKIKRKSANAATKVGEVKHEIIQESNDNMEGSTLDRLKQALVDKDRKSRAGTPLRAKERAAAKSKEDCGLVKKEPTDPYDFAARSDDSPPPTSKKIKTEKPDSFDSQPMHTLSTVWGKRDVGVETASVAVVTDPDCLGPCEPGTHVVLEGIVWNETPNGLLVVNVTWRGKTYVGTLMDATKHDWAPPRFNDDSSTADLDTRTPKGRGKRGRGGNNTPVSESCTVGERRLRKTRGRMGANNANNQPSSPGKGDLKRKADDEPVQDAPKVKRGKRLDAPGPDGMIECPEAHCCKRYRHVNGLRYHLTHFHKRNLIYDEEGNMITEAPEEFVKPAPVTDDKLRKRGLDANRVASPRKAPENTGKTLMPSPKKDDDKRKGKKGDKAVVSVTPVTPLPNEEKKSKAKKGKQVAAVAPSVQSNPPPEQAKTNTETAPTDTPAVKEPKKQKKKKKDKEKDKKKEHKSVIKSTGAPPPTPAVEGTKQPPELSRQNLQPPELEKLRSTPPELQKANGQTSEVSETNANPAPSTLNLSTPVKKVEPQDEDVHSPAYSDISDANDSVPVLEEQPQKSEKSGAKQQDLPETRSEEKPCDLVKPNQQFGLFPNSYYSQPPHLSPAVVSDAASDKKQKEKLPNEGEKSRPNFPPSFYMQDSHREQFMPPDFKAQKEAWVQKQREKDPEPVDMSAKKDQAADLSTRDKAPAKEIKKELETTASEKSLIERQKDELQSFYAFQQQRNILEQQARFMGKSKTHSPGIPNKPTSRDSPSASTSSSKPRRPEEDRDRPRSIERLNRPTPSPKNSDPKTSSSSSVPSSHPYHYPSSYPMLPQFDPANPNLYPPGMVPYGQNAYMHPSQIHYGEEDKGRKPEGGKALDLLQQRASQLYGVPRGHSPNAPPAHKINELKEAGKDNPKSPATKERENTPSGSKDDKTRPSPPPQRHLHTHHHTHVVGPPYPIYGHYPPVMTSPPHPPPPSSHSFISKP